MVHQPVSRGFAVFADAWLSGWLAEISADLRENGSALEVVLHDNALYESTITLLYTCLYLFTSKGLTAAERRLLAGVLMDIGSCSDDVAGWSAAAAVTASDVG